MQYHIATITFNDPDPQSHVKITATEEDGIFTLSYATSEPHLYENPNWIQFFSLEAMRQFIVRTYAAPVWGLILIKR